MLSRRRSRPPKRERADPWAKTAQREPRRFLSAWSASELRGGDAAGPGRRTAAAAAERRACGHRQALSARQRPSQGHRRDPFHGRRRPSGHAVARILRSPHPHAEVRAIDTAQAERDPRVRAIVPAVDFGFNMGPAEFEKSKRYGKRVPASFSISIETRSTFFRFQLGLIDRLIDRTSTVR